MQRILIVGAGPTGLTLAAVLSRHGVLPRMIEARSVPPEDRSRAIVLQARTLEVFRDLGVDGEILDAALQVDAVTLCLPSGKRASLRFRPEWVESRFSRLTSLPQDETERVLADLIARQGVRVERGVRLAAVSDSGEAAVCTLVHADGREERYEADWVVGADGAHSAVRQAAGLSFDGQTYDDEAMLGDVEMEWMIRHGELTGCPGANGFLLSFPLPGANRFRIIIIKPASAPPEARNLSEEEFMGAVRSMLPRSDTAPRLLGARWLTRYRLHRRGVAQYRRGRLFVAGDAAHIHSPVGAQGMNTGIQDSYNLGWKLALVARGEAPVAILDSYNEERLPVGEKLLKGTDVAFAYVARGGPVAALLRRLLPEIGVRLIATGPLGKRLARLVSQTRVRYRHSSLVRAGRHASELPAGAPRAGDRLPDTDVGGRWLHDVTSGPMHTVLVIPGEGGHGGSHAHLEMEFHPHVRVAVLERHVTLAPLAARNGALYAIRPDKHIGFAGTPADADELRGWLRSILSLPVSS